MYVSSFIKQFYYKTMSTIPIFDPDPDQLNRILSIGVGTEASAAGICNDKTVAGLADKWLVNTLRENACLRDPLLQQLSSLGLDARSFADKSLFELLLEPTTGIVVLEAISRYAKELSLSLRSEAESLIAIAIYYATAARLLLSHNKKISEYSYENLLESFDDLVNKKWITPELKELFDKAKKICEQELKYIDATSQPDAKQKFSQVSESSSSNESEPSGSEGQACLDLFAKTPRGSIGRYKLLSVLGEGGMGIVYLAEQEHPIKRSVALKVIKPGMDSKRIIARFEAERQALALLDHPNIAHVYDAGTTENGRPYFAMEYVKGLAITEHCDHHRLSIKDRLNLFLQVCHAVQHAHQKGIIHRDIKSSNILVSLEDDKALPKVIDFGVAKALAQPLTERTFTTEQGQLFGTPEYMSPEQVDMANDDIDTRSDIYSLGVLLYVLLTGVLPFDSKTFREGGIEHIRRVIYEIDPKTPSSRLTGLGDQAKKVAEGRQTEVAKLTRCLHKELEWIPLKAMRKKRTERYQSASELADDIESYMNSTPLMAGPPTAIYKLKKFIHRHAALFTGITSVLIVLVAGIVVSTLLTVGQIRARAETQAVSDFLRLSILESLDPYKVGGRQITIRTVLDAASKDLQGKFTPMAEAEIRHTIGFVYWSLGLYEQHEFHYKRAIDICRAQLGDEDATTLLWLKELGWGYFYRSRFEEARRLLTEAVEGMRRVLGIDDERTLHSLYSLGILYCMQGHFHEAESLFSEIQTAKFKWNEGLFLGGLAWCYRLQGRYEEGERPSIMALEFYRRQYSNTDFITLLLMRNLGELYCDTGRYNEAEQLLLEASNGWRHAWGEEHPEILWNNNALGWLYYSQSKSDKAQSLFDKTLQTARRIFGESHFVTAQSMHGLGTIYLAQGRYDQSEPLLTNACDILCGILGEENWATLSVKNTLAKLYMAQGRDVKAEKLYLDTMEARRHKLGKDHPGTLETINDLAVLYMKQNLFDKAEPLLVEALEGRRLKLGDTHPHTLESWNNLIDLYEAWNKPEKAQEWRAKLPQIEAVDE
jgi:pentatricopeptide repeat protein